MSNQAASASVYKTGTVIGNSGDTRYADGVAVSGTTVYYSDRSQINGLADSSYQLQWTGTPNGTFIVQVSNKPDPINTTDADWITLPLSVAIVQPAGSASGDLVDLAGCPFKWVRLKYTNASSTGTIFAWFAGKL